MTYLVFCVFDLKNANREDYLYAYMDLEALEVTLREKRACFWSRSRQKLWRKGETSGNVLHVLEIRTDCDADALAQQDVKSAFRD